MSSLYILDVNPLLDLSFMNIFSHTVGYLFCSIDGVLCCTEAFQLDIVPVVHFCFCFPCHIDGIFNGAKELLIFRYGNGMKKKSEKL